MKTLRYVNKAAKELSKLNFRDVSYISIMVYYSFSTQKSSLASELVSYPYEQDDAFKKWGKKEWRKLILEKSKGYAGLCPVAIKSIMIAFNLEGDREMYHIEMTEVEEGRFDRIIDHSRYPLREIVLNMNESSRIRGVYDVVKATHEFPRVRTTIVSSDLPKVVVESRRNPRNYRLGCR
ncbi:hypothetical protein IK110_00510 [Candidatus Saccharibacteria bacterium]|nr:hypothetical protein [Candidatus Saccharibacteria bacterium]